jgi:putative permease
LIPGPQQVNLIKRERRFKLAAVLGLLAIGLTVLLAVPGMLVSFLLAFVISYLFKPAVNWLERNRIERTLAILLLYAIAATVIGISSRVLIQRASDQIESLQHDFPNYVEGLDKLIKTREAKFNATFNSYFKLDVSSRVTQWAATSGPGFINQIPNVLSNLLTTLILAPFFAFFMLRDGRSMVHKLLALVPNQLFELALNLTYQINQQLGGFIRARLLESIIVGAVVWVGLFFMGFPYALLLASFAGLTNLIPYIGPIIGAAPAIILSVVNSDPVTRTTIVGMIFLAAQLVDMLFIIPLVVAKIVDLHPVTVVIVIIIGSQVMGILGMIISVPVASILKLTTSEIYQHLTGFRS